MFAKKSRKLSNEHDLLRYFCGYFVFVYPEWFLEGETETVGRNCACYSNADDSHPWHLLQGLDNSDLLCSNMVDRR